MFSDKLITDSSILNKLDYDGILFILFIRLYESIFIIIIRLLIIHLISFYINKTLSK